MSAMINSTLAMEDIVISNFSMEHGIISHLWIGIGNNLGGNLSAFAMAANDLVTITDDETEEKGAEGPRNGDNELCPLLLTTTNKVVSVLFFMIFCLSVCGNSLVMVTIVQQKWMRTVTNLYLLNLAVSDLLLIVICMPPSLLAILYQCFLFGATLCRIINFLQPVSVTANAYTLAVIALERYFAICKPLQSRQWQTKSHALKMISLTWALAFVTNIFCFFAAQLREYRPGRYNCTQAKWMTNGWSLVAMVFTAVFLFLLPLCIMLTLYGLVIHNLFVGIQLEVQSSRTIPLKANSVLHRVQKTLRIPTKTTQALLRMSDSGRGNHPPLKCPNLSLRSTHSEKSLLAKKRVIRMLLTVVFIFTICWTPLYTYLLYIRVCFYMDIRPNFTVMPYFLVMAYLSTCSNPIAYCFLNKKFRAAFLLAFGCRNYVKEKFGTTFLNLTSSQHIHHYHRNQSQYGGVVYAAHNSIRLPINAILMDGSRLTKTTAQRDQDDNDDDKSTTTGIIMDSVDHSSNNNNQATKHHIDDIPPGCTSSGYVYSCQHSAFNSTSFDQGLASNAAVGVKISNTDVVGRKSSHLAGKQKSHRHCTVKQRSTTNNIANGAAAVMFQNGRQQPPKPKVSFPSSLSNITKKRDLSTTPFNDASPSTNSILAQTLHNHHESSAVVVGIERTAAATQKPSIELVKAANKSQPDNAQVDSDNNDDGIPSSSSTADNHSSSIQLPFSTPPEKLPPTSRGSTNRTNSVVVVVGKKPSTPTISSQRAVIVDLPPIPKPRRALIIDNNNSNYYQRHRQRQQKLSIIDNNRKQHLDNLFQYGAARATDVINDANDVNNQNHLSLVAETVDTNVIISSSSSSSNLSSAAKQSGYNNHSKGMRNGTLP